MFRICPYNSQQHSALVSHLCLWSLCASLCQVASGNLSGFMALKLNASDLTLRPTHAHFLSGIRLLSPPLSSTLHDFAHTPPVPPSPNLLGISHGDLKDIKRHSPLPAGITASISPHACPVQGLPDRMMQQLHSHVMETIQHCHLDTL